MAKERLSMRKTKEILGTTVVAGAERSRDGTQRKREHRA
jgi:hypothetical protein